LLARFHKKFLIFRSALVRARFDTAKAVGYSAGTDGDTGERLGGGQPLGGLAGYSAGTDGDTGEQAQI
jgi:hypothetical protein